MSRGPGKLQREILDVVAEHGPIAASQLADYVVGPLVYESSVGDTTGPSAYIYKPTMVDGSYMVVKVRVPSDRHPTKASEAARRNVRRAVASLLKSGRLEEAPRELSSIRAPKGEVAGWLDENGWVFNSDLEQARVRKGPRRLRLPRQESLAVETGGAAEFRQLLSPL